MSDKHIMPAQFSEREADYSDSAGDDFEALSRDQVLVRTLTAEDLENIIRIDGRTTGLDRRSYLTQKVDEALNESAIRVSLVAEHDGATAGFVMARMDFGEFDRSEPMAVMDTFGVDPAFSGQGVGRALISQLLMNLAALGVEKLETQVAPANFALLGFLYHCGFEPGQRLVFNKPIA